MARICIAHFRHVSSRHGEFVRFIVLSLFVPYELIYRHFILVCVAVKRTFTCVLHSFQETKHAC